jgi:hypothetical protein
MRWMVGPPLVTVLILKDHKAPNTQPANGKKRRMFQSVNTTSILISMVDKHILEVHHAIGFPPLVTEIFLLL